MKVDILAIGAHPDDVELGCSGTLIKYIKMGKSAAVLDLTRGELGTRGTVQTRDEEAANSSNFLGLRFRKNLSLADGFFEYNRDNIIEIVKVIRYCQPEIVLMNAVNDRHIDHGKGAKLAADACFLSGLVKIETSYEGETQKAWRPRLCLHYIQDYYLEPDIILDISDHIDEKIKSIMMFKTQFYNPESKEPETPISGIEFLNFIKARAKDFARPIGTKYAEGFTSVKYLGVDNMFNLL